MKQSRVVYEKRQARGVLPIIILCSIAAASFIMLMFPMIMAPRPYQAKTIRSTSVASTVREFSSSMLSTALMSTTGGCEFASVDTSSTNLIEKFKKHSPIHVVGLHDYRVFEHKIVNGMADPTPEMKVIWLPQWDSDEDKGAVVIFRHAYVTGLWAHIYDCRVSYLQGGCQVHPHPGRVNFDHQWLQQAPHVLKGAIVLIAQRWGDNFYHFLIEDIMRLALVHSYLLENPSARVLTYITNGCRRMLALLGIDESRIVSYHDQSLYLAETLIVPTASGCGRVQGPALQYIKSVVMYDIMFSKATAVSISLSTTTVIDRKAFVQDRFNGIEPKHSTTRILVHRRDPGAKRSLENHVELMSRLRTEFPDSFIEEFCSNELFDTAIEKHMMADLIIAPHGAGLANTIFSRVGASVIELHPFNGNGLDMSGPNHFNTCHMMTIIRGGLNYRAVLSREDGSWATPIVVPINPIINHAVELLSNNQKS